MTKKYVRREINQEFFKEINEKSAYVLGWIMSDGHIQLIPEKKYSIRFELKDIDALETIRELMGSTHTITPRPNKNTHTLVMDSKPLVKQLLELGVVPQKTGKEVIPNIPKEYYRDFIRGFFDGDGSVMIAPKKNNNNQLRSYICCSSKEFLVSVGKVLKDEAYLIPKIYEDSPKFYKLVYGGKESYQFYKYMYDGAEHFLKRKKDIFEKGAEVKAGTGLMNCVICKKEIVRTSGRKKYCGVCLKKALRDQEILRNKRRREKKALRNQ